MAASGLITNADECYSDEDEDYFANDDGSAGSPVDDELSMEAGLAAGWQLAARGVALALNNRVEEAQNLLRVDSSCIHRQAGFCYLTFIVSILISIQFRKQSKQSRDSSLTVP